jgi:hypothetical protein
MATRDSLIQAASRKFAELARIDVISFSKFAEIFSEFADIFVDSTVPFSEFAAHQRMKA